MSETKLLICGLGRAGKDQFAEFLRLPFEPSSMVALDACIWDEWGKGRYNSKEDCFNDRINHRMDWFNRIRIMNAEDPTTLGKLIFKDNPIYVGIRSIIEFEALRSSIPNLVAVWVDARERLPHLVDESCQITQEDCDFMVDNNKGLGELKAQAANTKRHYYGACMTKPQSCCNESTAEYYELPDGATKLQHLIAYKDMNGQVAEMFRGLYRYGQVSHSPKLRDMKKIKFYAEAEIERLEKYEPEAPDKRRTDTVAVKPWTYFYRRRSDHD